MYFIYFMYITLSYKIRYERFSLSSLCLVTNLVKIPKKLKLFILLHAVKIYYPPLCIIFLRFLTSKGKIRGVQRARGGLMTKLYRKYSLADVHEEDIILPSYLGRVLRWWRRSVVNSRPRREKCCVNRKLHRTVSRVREKLPARVWRDNWRLRFETAITRARHVMSIPDY